MPPTISQRMGYDTSCVVQWLRAVIGFALLCMPGLLASTPWPQACRAQSITGPACVDTTQQQATMLLLQNIWGLLLLPCCLL